MSKFDMVDTVINHKTLEFIKKADKVHGNKYNYSKVTYTKSREKIIIICNEHGEFKQTPNGHLCKKGCGKCSNNVQSSTKDFINKAILIHGDKYDYSKVNYTSRHKKVIIICKEHGEFYQEAGSHLNNSGCKLCGITVMKNKQKSNTKDFINKAILIHGDKYDYSKVNYTSRHKKVIIICKEHGEFYQEAGSHLNNSGCKLCGINEIKNKKTMSFEEFINKAILIHGDKYSYSKIDYDNKLSKIIITCKIHGNFEKMRLVHLQGQGCPKCSKKYRMNQTEFINECKILHDNKYDYSEVKYTKKSCKVTIICKKHGKFEQNASAHIRGQGCLKCNGKPQSNTREFIQKAIKVHSDKYDYSKVLYKRAINKVIISCYKHGEFLQTPNGHLNGSGCTKCNSNYSKLQIQWLELLEKINNIYIQHANNEGEFKIRTTRYLADGYCAKTNTIYEFNGDYFHGNPKIFKPDGMNKLCKQTYGVLYQKTLDKEKKIKELGFNLVVMWESEWIIIVKSIIFIQRSFRKNKNSLNS